MFNNIRSAICGLLLVVWPASAQQSFNLLYGTLALNSGPSLDTIFLEHPTIQSVTFTALVNVGHVIVYECGLLTDLSFPALKAHTSAINYPIYIYDNVSLRTINLSALVSSANAIQINYNPALTNLQLSKLAFTYSYFSVVENDALTTLDLPALVSVSTYPFLGLTASGCNNLANVSLPKYLPTKGRPQSFDGCALTQASVDGILARCVAATGYTSGTVNLSGGTSASPSAAGLVNVAILQARGVTVIHN